MPHYKLVNTTITAPFGYAEGLSFNTVSLREHWVTYNADYGSFVNPHKHVFVHTADTCASSSSETYQLKN